MNKKLVLWIFFLGILIGLIYSHISTHGEKEFLDCVNRVKDESPIKFNHDWCYEKFR